MEKLHTFYGVLVLTIDGYIRHQLLPNFRYDEARGSKKVLIKAVSYTIPRNHIDYKDDTGFTADGEFKDDILYHAGMILYKEK
ncbi:Atu4866 domain-containing protein [Parapedobacter tibetensis]|uniref:Atu4866 domain-containing protein n=1 Tax=Parapedobacter tibetensis TaxID=2972951 RepID=UPI00214D81AC|nr:Atu4866 domain-containing protein [Parapedobacter tibetensis]